MGEEAEKSLGREKAARRPNRAASFDFNFPDTRGAATKPRRVRDGRIRLVSAQKRTSAPAKTKRGALARGPSGARLVMPRSSKTFCTPPTSRTFCVRS